jgi:hypothetical protein
MLYWTSLQTRMCFEEPLSRAPQFRERNSILVWSAGVVIELKENALHLSDTQ